MIPKPPRPSTSAVSAVMRGNRSRDTEPEIVVRRLLTRLGYRYRIHAASVPGRPDLYFARRRKAVFVHGCFWHQHSSRTCPLRSAPKSNRHYWDAKLARNVQRDADHLRALADAGISTIVIWECELKELDRVAKALSQFLGAPRWSDVFQAEPL